MMSEKPQPYDTALMKLIKGNKRFVLGKAEHPHQTVEHGKTLVETQAPFACIVTCSDSRVPPEILFDQGLGDLFVVRVAGNIVSDTSVMGSIEYGVIQLQIPLVIVLGHTGCGAVASALSGSSYQGHIDSLLSQFKFPMLKTSLLKDPVQAVRLNVQTQVSQLLENDVFMPLIKAKQLKIQGAVYNMETGEVEWI
ncbi:carbonic anhydrase [Thermoproteota archaeon]